MSTPAPFGRAPAALPAELEARLTQALAAEHAAPTRPWWRDAAIFVGVTVALFGLGSLLFNAALPPLEVEGGVWAQAVALLVVSLVAGVAGLAPWPQRTSRPLILGGLAAATVVVTQLVSLTVGPLKLVMGCFLWEIACSLVPAALALLAARAYAPRLSRAMVLGWAAGTLALAVMQLKCPHRDVGHVLLLHLLPLGLVVAATVLVRRRLSTSSYAP
ncbi:MAG: hypothetical protein JNJ54_08250 [Myxococcaceae bacterium]|nr:hypothetical protein [Myxococcaceae bacterium]